MHTTFTTAYRALLLLQLRTLSPSGTFSRVFVDVSGKVMRAWLESERQLLTWQGAGAGLDMGCAWAAVCLAWRVLPQAQGLSPSLLARTTLLGLLACRHPCRSLPSWLGCTSRSFQRGEGGSWLITWGDDGGNYVLNNLSWH